MGPWRNKPVVVRFNVDNVFNSQLLGGGKYQQVPLSRHAEDVSAFNNIHLLEMAERTHAEILVDRSNATGVWRRWHIALRVFVVIVGGYAATAALVAGVARVLPVAGLARSEAVALASMCGFVFLSRCS